MHSNIALAKSYSQVKKHVGVTTGSFAVDLGGTIKGSNEAIGTVDLVDSSGQPMDCNFCHIAFMVYTTNASDVNATFLVVEPSGTNRTNKTDVRNSYHMESAVAVSALTEASGMPGVIIYPTISNTGEATNMSKDEHTWHFPIGSIKQFKYQAAALNAIKPGSNTHMFLVVTYGKEYPENVRAMLDGNPGN